MFQDDEMLDPDHCQSKAVEYAAKAKATLIAALKSAYEAKSREYLYRTWRPLKELYWPVSIPVAYFEKQS